MSGLDKILAKILADAQAKGELEIAEAQRKADAFLSGDAAEAALQSENRIAEAEAEARSFISRSLSAASLQSKRLLLKERNRIIDEVLSDVKSYVCTMPDIDYFLMLKHFVLSHAQKEPGTLILNKRDLARLPDGFKSSLTAKMPVPLTISGTPGEFDAGCILIFGEIEYNGTLDALISEKKDELRDLLNKQLFAE